MNISFITSNFATQIDKTHKSSHLSV